MITWALHTRTDGHRPTSRRAASPGLLAIAQSNHRHSLEDRWCTTELLSPLFYPLIEIGRGESGFALVDFPTVDIPDTYTIVIDLIELNKLVAVIQASDPEDKFYKYVAGIVALLLHLFVFYTKQQAYLDIGYQIGAGEPSELQLEEQAFDRYANTPDTHRRNADNTSQTQTPYYPTIPENAYES